MVTAAAAWCDDKAESVVSLCDLLIEAGSLMSQKVTDYCIYLLLCKLLNCSIEDRCVVK